MSRLNIFFRKIVNNRNRRNLKNTDFSLISSNCNGGFLLHDLGLRFNSPTINLWISPCDYIIFLRNLPYYLSCDMTFTTEPGISYPIGVLDDIRIYFEHYTTEEEAKRKWIERSSRLRYDNLFVMFTDRDGCTYQNLADFDALPLKNKVVFTHVPYPEFGSAFYLKGWEDESSVGSCFAFKNKYTGKKHYDEFDYVKWFNGHTD